MSVQPCVAAKAAMSSHTALWTAASRTMPFLIAARGASNCGLISASRLIGAAASGKATGRISFSEMKLASITTTSGRCGSRLPA